MPKKKISSVREKYINFLKSRENNGHFLDGIARIRKMYDLPKEGISKEFSILEGLSLIDFEKLFDFEDEISDLAEKHDMKKDWLLVRNYVFFNDFLDDENDQSLVKNIDFSETTKKFSEVNTLEKLKFFGENEPIMISISPMASRNEIIEHIKKTYSTEIAELQKLYKPKKPILGKINARDPKTTEIHLFIYKNKNRSAKEIATLVSEKYKVVYDYTYITKIIKSMSRP